MMNRALFPMVVFAEFIDDAIAWVTDDDDLSIVIHRFVGEDVGVEIALSTLGSDV